MNGCQRALLQETCLKLKTRSPQSPNKHYTILYSTLLCHAMLCYAMLCYAMLCYAMLCYAILYYTILYYTILYYTILYSTLLYSTLLYSTLLYYTLLYYTILYFPILYRTILSIIPICRLRYLIPALALWHGVHCREAAIHIVLACRCISKGSGTPVEIIRSLSGLYIGNKHWKRFSDPV